VIERQIARLSVDISPIRQIATVRTVGSPDYKELFDIGGGAFEWVGEAGHRNQTNTPDMAEVAPTFGMASAKPQASEESLDDLFFNVEDWLTMSAAEAIAAGEGAAFVNGNGTKKPTGFLAGPAPVATADSAAPSARCSTSPPAKPPHCRPASTRSTTWCIRCAPAIARMPAG
jgi:HK97 family phage major capsid protein